MRDLHKHFDSLLIFSSSAALFALLLYLTQSNNEWLISLDAYINSVIPVLHNTITNPFFFYISELFELKVFLIWFVPLLALLVYKRHFYKVSFLIVGVAFGQIFKTIIKLLTNKPRPENPFGIIDNASSFPSGHAAAGVFLFLAIYYLVTPYISQRWRTPTQVLLIICMIAVPFSRIFLQVHYASDVVAGVLLSIMSLSFTIFIFDFLFFSTNSKQIKDKSVIVK